MGTWSGLVSTTSHNQANLLLPQGASAKDIVQGTAAGVLLQLVLGAPFLVAAPASYLRKAFELSRVFLHQWTVNLHFLPEVRHN